MVAAAAAVTAAAGLAGCGGEAEAGPPVLTWYINNAYDATIAERCSQEADEYDIQTELLPASPAAQREQLLRRLAANDTSIDVMSLDPPFMAEFANAGFLRPFTQEEQAEFSDGVLQGALEQSLYEGTMYGAPFFANTQLLWYKKSVAEAAGLDLEDEPVTWEQLVAAAEQTQATVAVQGRRNESLMVWVNALVASAGGTILDPDSEGQQPEDVEAVIDSPPGSTAAEIINRVATSSAAPPALSTAGEEESRAAFQAEDGGFMVNWPYVWAAFAAAEEAGTLPADFREDVGWAQYPRVDPDTPSANPIGGVGLSIGAFTQHPELAVDAVRCVRSVESQVEHMLNAGEPGSAAAVYEDPQVHEAFPMWQEIRDGLVEAAPRPITPYYGDVTGAVQQGYHPPGQLSPETTPDRTARLIEGVLSNEQLL
ncbi:extracellular solute-binding protein [Quadrisphaera sp. DSM 44207]|uniref:extracellular solute-binding protein n=1 Tax=Quadrisphaera sp. DSM 44207 TaxID=1881057 RepID=UPI00088B3F82|nr:extracellular solute-binding protein [Quadrisphaera sp. DSM 44207]SDQ03976.1 carbohydrate ABC transporter substrate-binding protein, CUT1 family [Quadrisphaera sp. DSM 44207]